MTNTGLIDDARMHVSTDLSTPGVHLIIGESQTLINATRIELKPRGMTY